MRNSSAEVNGPADEAKIVSITLKAIAIIAAIFGNSLVFKAFHKFPSLRTASNSILVSLSAADILTVIPFILHISFIALGLGENLNPTNFQFLCNSSARSSLVVISVIILHLVLISVERVIAIKFALRYHTIVTNRRAVIACLIVWLWAISITLLFPLGLRLDDNEGAYEVLYQALRPCIKKPELSIPSSSRGYFIFLIISLLVIPVLIILCSYGYIFFVSLKHRTQIKEQCHIQGISAMKDELNGAYTLAIVVAVCFLSFVPLWVVIRYRFFDTSFVVRKPWLRYSVYDVALGLNACLNPIIYGWRHEKFRKAFRKLLKSACGKVETE